MNRDTIISSELLEKFESAKLIRNDYFNRHGITNPTLRDLVYHIKKDTEIRRGKALSILTDGKVSDVLGCMLYNLQYTRVEYGYYGDRYPGEIMLSILENLENTDDIEDRFNKIILNCNSTIAVDVAVIVNTKLTSTKLREPYVISFNAFRTSVVKTELYEWLLKGYYIDKETENTYNCMPNGKSYGDNLYDYCLFAENFSHEAIWVLGRIGSTDILLVNNLKRFGNMTELLKHFRGKTHVKLDYVMQTIKELRDSKILGAEFNWETSSENETGIKLSEIWIYDIQDGITGGIIFADSEAEAKEKLQAELNVDCDDIASIYPLSALDLNKPSGVHQLW